MQLKADTILMNAWDIEYLITMANVLNEDSNEGFEVNQQQTTAEEWLLGYSLGVISHLAWQGKTSLMQCDWNFQKNCGWKKLELMTCAAICHDWLQIVLFCKQYAIHE